MKKMILSLAAASAFAGVALPAAAQPWDARDHRYEARWNDHRRFDVTDRLEMRIDRAYRTRQITRQEYYSLRRLVGDLERLEHRYMRDGHLSGWERSDLRRKANYVENRLRRERMDRDWGYYR
jgi:hypothetical protein